MRVSASMRPRFDCPLVVTLARRKALGDLQHQFFGVGRTLLSSAIASRLCPTISAISISPPAEEAVVVRQVRPSHGADTEDHVLLPRICRVRRRSGALDWSIAPKRRLVCSISSRRSGRHLGLEHRWDIVDQSVGDRHPSAMRRIFANHAAAQDGPRAMRSMSGRARHARASGKG